jgi:hypothetical protein
MLSYSLQKGQFGVSFVRVKLVLKIEEKQTSISSCFSRERESYSDLLLVCFFNNL